MFQMNYAAKILECHLKLLNAIRIGGYLPDRVINLILQYLSNRSDILYGLLLINFRNLSEYEFSGSIELEKSLHLMNQDMIFLALMESLVSNISV